MSMIVVDKQRIKLKRKETFLHPGDYYFCSSPNIIGTLLGSCVAITLWHPHLKIGGMCHFVLPKQVHGKIPHVLDGRYADDALKLFDKSAKQYKTKLNEYEAKIFGGGNHVRHETDRENIIGIKNAEVAMLLLVESDINILVVDVGENWTRRIIFELQTGDVWVKKQ